MSATLGLDAARALDPSGYAMSGTAPRFAIRPADRGELCEALRAATRDGLGVVPWGGGVSLSREAAPPRFDVALDLRGLDRVTEYEPDDLTLTAECGVTIESLREKLQARGQELPLEAAEAWGATLGGVLASNASGARRQALGSPRDRILGARFALGEGTLARSGGKVVKNVAGYGIHRLLCGSRGGLAVIVEVSLKLQPAPASRAAMVFGVDAATIADAGRWSFIPRMEPSALTVIGRAAADLNPVLSTRAPFTTVIGFEGEAAHVERQCESVRQALGAAKVKVADDSATKLWQHLADLEELQGPRLSFTTTANTPAALAALGDDFVIERCVFHAPCGRLHVFPAADQASVVLSRLRAAGFTLIDARGVALEARATSIGIETMRGAIRRALDPGARFALGG
ncbi:MAG TPA: FAD-binding oxidoreductase [Candidatus Udaeobacter sp.]|jgi:glycolate oxidase FAD binding subunit|nr:FAD-binding oxidoreductase [Candidatus Udaeobacter sp.]